MLLSSPYRLSAHPRCVELLQAAPRHTNCSSPPSTTAKLRRAWRNTFFVRHYESPGPADASAGPLAAQVPAVVIPAGCVMIDSALGEVPPPIFGPPVNLVFRVPRKPRAMTSVGARRVQAKEEKRAARRSRVAAHKAQAKAARSLRSPETRAGVHAFHARRRAVEVPYDPGMDVAMRNRPESSWARADAQDKAERLARREETLAEARRERKDRQQEDRAGLRPFEACKRARQEAFSIPHVPSEFGPTAAPAQRRMPARGPRGVGVGHPTTGYCTAAQAPP